MYRKLWTYGWREYLVLTALILCTFPLMYVSLEIPKHIVNVLSGTEDAWVRELLGAPEAFSALMLLSGALLFVSLLFVLLAEGIKMLKGIYAQRVIQRLRHDMYAGFTPAAPEQANDFASSLTYETQQLKGFLEEVAATPFQEGGALLTALIFVFAQDWRLGILAIAVVPLQAALVIIFQKPINSIHDASVEALRRLHEVSKGQAGERVQEAIDENYQLQRRMFTTKFSAKIAVHALAKMPTILFYVVGGYLVLQGDLTLGAIVAVIAANQTFQGHWNAIFTFYRIKEGAKVQFQRIQSLAGL